MSFDQAASILDSSERVQNLDRRNMLRLTNELPEQCEIALRIAHTFEFNYAQFVPSAVLITGSHESELVGRMAVVVAAQTAKIPIISSCGQALPACVDDRSLVIVVDLTGKSRKSLDSYREARARGAQLVCAVAPGELAEAANKDGIRVIKLPSGQPARSAIGYVFVQLLALLAQYRLIGPVDDFVDSAVKLLKNARESLRFECPTAINQAKKTAEFLYGKFAIVMGPSDYRAIIADRWRSQIRANSKRLAFTWLFCGDAETELVAFQKCADTKSDFGVVLLKDPLDRNSEIGAAVEKTKEVVRERWELVELDNRGTTLTEKLFYGLYFADYVSYYLALLYEVDPTPTFLPGMRVATESSRELR